MSKKASCIYCDCDLFCEGCEKILLEASHGCFCTEETADVRCGECEKMNYYDRNITESGGVNYVSAADELCGSGGYKVDSVKYNDWDDDQWELDYGFDNEFTGKDDYTFYSKCRHYNFPLEFPSGIVVHPSSMHHRDSETFAPDMGYYLDYGWSPTGLASFLDWQDYGLPNSEYAALVTIMDAYKKAKAGLWVEVGCIGGHGRTGTFLACMLVIDGLTPVEAIAYIKKNYCTKAIENQEQEWFVGLFEAMLYGGKIDEYKTSKGEEIIQFEYLLDYSQLIYEDGDIATLLATHAPPEDMVQRLVEEEYKTKNKTTPKEKSLKAELKAKLKANKENAK